MKRWLAAFLVALVIVVAACSRSEQPGLAAAAMADDDKPRYGGTLYRRLDTDVVTLNPVLTTSRYDRLVQTYLFTPLISLDINLNPIPGLAASWDISADGKVYTFHLDEKATFSDGTPVKASDLLFTLRKIVDPLSEAAQIASAFEHMDLARTRVVDDHTAVVAFREALASQLTQFNTVMVIPEHVYGKGDFKKDYNDTALGSGPYVLARREAGKEVVVLRRPDFWGTRPYIDSVVFKIIISGITAWNAVKRGDIDETMVQSDIWAREHTDPALMKKLAFRRFYGLSYNYIGWNERLPLFADRRVRRALTMCLDVKSVINNLYGGTARAMSGHFVPEQWAFNPSVPVIEFDLEGAKRTFTSLGWLDTDGDGVLDKGGKPFRFDLMITSGSAPAMALAQTYQADFKKVGVQADISVVDPAVAIQRTIFQGNYQAAYLSWDLDPDPDPFALFHSSQIPPRGQNFVYYSNPEADRLIEEGRRELKQSRRADLYRELHAVLAADQPYTWINQPSLKWAVTNRVGGVKEGKGVGLFGWYPGEFDWWIRTGTLPAGT